MKMHRPPTAGKERKLDIIKFKDGDVVNGIVIGEFHTYYARWNGKYFEHAQKGADGAKFRFRVNFAVKDGGAFHPRVLESGSMLYERLFEVNEEFPIDENVITIKRKGSGQNDTEYIAQLSGKVKLSKEEGAYLATLEPLDLRLDEEIETDKFNEI